MFYNYFNRNIIYMYMSYIVGYLAILLFINTRLIWAMPLCISLSSVSILTHNILKYTYKYMSYIVGYLAILLFINTRFDMGNAFVYLIIIRQHITHKYFSNSDFLKKKLYLYLLL